MDSIQEVLFGIDDYLPFLYSVILVVSIAFFKRFTSLLFVAIVLTIGEFGMNTIRDPLWAFIDSLSFQHANLMWFGTWIFCNALLVWVLHKLHIWGNVSKSTVAHQVSYVMAALSILQLIKMIDALTYQFEPILWVYQFSIPAINVGLGAYILLVMIRNTVDVDFNVRTGWRRDN